MTKQYDVTSNPKSNLSKRTSEDIHTSSLNEFDRDKLFFGTDISSTTNNHSPLSADNFLFADNLAYPSSSLSPSIQPASKRTLTKNIAQRPSYKTSLENVVAGYSMNRMGQSKTLLPDGRTILIGGKHEEHHDPEFIYNDVIVKHPDSRVEVYAYPQHIFPPTDFHTATLVDDDIWIIGSIGYPDNRQYSLTPVYRLNIHNYKITRVETVNNMGNIGWIHGHSAMLKDRQIIVTAGKLLIDNSSPMRENIDTWAFNLKTRIWQNLSKRQWQMFYIEAKHQHDFYLWEFSQLEFTHEYQANQYELKQAELAQSLGIQPNLLLYRQLFVPPIVHETLPPREADAHRSVSIMIDEIRVRYVDEGETIIVYVEGILPDKTLSRLQDNLCYKLAKLANVSCEVKEWADLVGFGS